MWFCDNARRGAPGGDKPRYRLSFPKIKIAVDVSLVVLSVVSCYMFWGAWQWNIIGPGTLFAMFYVGYIVKLLSGHLGWFDRLLCRPGMRRYVFGLARYIYHRFK